MEGQTYIVEHSGSNDMFMFNLNMKPTGVMR